MLGLAFLFAGITGFITLWHIRNLFGNSFQPKLCQCKKSLISDNYWKEEKCILTMCIASCLSRTISMSNLRVIWSTDIQGRY